VIDEGVEPFDYRGQSFVATKDQIVFMNAGEVHAHDQRSRSSDSHRTVCTGCTQTITNRKEHMKKLIIAALALVAALLPLHGFAQSKAHRVLFAITSSNQSDWQMTLGNISNLKKGLAPETVEVEVVAYGPGIAMVKKDSVVSDEMQTLEKEGVAFVGCENSMRRMQLTKADLVPGVGTVPSGIVEVVKKQEAGWSYVKAGQ
jgi:intracellular sulfur oxidation DsrE/DsrF family protein